MAPSCPPCEPWNLDASHGDLGSSGSGAGFREVTMVGRCSQWESLAGFTTFYNHSTWPWPPKEPGNAWVALRVRLPFGQVWPVVAPNTAQDMVLMRQVTVSEQPSAQKTDVIWIGMQLQQCFNNASTITSSSAPLPHYHQNQETSAVW